MLDAVSAFIISLLVRVVTQTASEDSSADRDSWMSLHGLIDVLDQTWRMSHANETSGRKIHKSKDGFPKTWIVGLKQKK